MIGHRGIDENLRFLLLEVRRQLDRTRELAEVVSTGADPSRVQSLRESLIIRDDYVDNLKGTIQRKCYAVAREDDDVSLDALRAINTVASNVENLGDFCVDIASQLSRIEHPDALASVPVSHSFDIIGGALEQVEPALDGRDIQIALSICRAELVLDEIYAEAFADIIAALEDDDSPGAQSPMTALFIAHYFERMGDALLNMGEAFISAFLGKRIKLEQYEVLAETLEGSEMGVAGDQIELESVGETRSGCRIARLSSRHRARGPDAPGTAIFKEGRADKLREERDAIERWHTLMPGLVPRILSYTEGDDNAALLLEFLQGHTFDEVVLTGTHAEVEAGIEAIGARLRQVWGATRSDVVPRVDFVAQIRRRLEAMYDVHPEFEGAARIAGVDVRDFEVLLDRVAPLERRLKPDFSVFIHGDFNVDNVLYDPAAEDEPSRVRFIDVHRSRPADYVQDVSVFLVSNYRMQVFDAPVRARIGTAIESFARFARVFAASQHDRMFEARLTLGIARSLATSTRFVLDPEFARGMFLRSRFLLERVLEAQDALDAFEIPMEVLLE